MRASLAWWVAAIVACMLLLPTSSAKRSKKGKSKKHRLQPPPVELSGRQRAAQEGLVQRGMQLAAAGRLDDAEEAFGAALRVDPTNYAALGNRALLLPQMGRGAEGVEALERAALLYPSDPAIPYNLGTLHASLDQDADAVPHFLRASEVAPIGSEVKIYAINSAGASFFKLDRPAEALHFFDKALVAQKRNSVVDANTLQQTTLNRAASLVKLGRAAESIETYSRTIDAAPHDVASRLSRANAWKEIGGLEGGLQSATDYIGALELMAEQGIDEVQIEQGGGGNGTKERVADIYDDAVYALQAWERDFDRESAGGSDAKKSLDISLPLWRRTASCLDNVVPKLNAGTSMFDALWGGHGNDDGGQAAGASGTDGCVAMGLSVDECDAVGQMLSPSWARNSTALSLIRRALAQGRPVHITDGAFQHDVADQMQLEIEREFAQASPEALAAREPLPIRRHREDKVGQRSYETGKPRVDLEQVDLQRLYAPVVAARANRTNAGPELAGTRLCAEALAAYRGEFQFQVHGTSTTSIDGSLPIHHWLETPQAAMSKRFVTAMRSSPLSRFFSALLHEAGGASGGVGDVGDLEPILAATEYRTGDYLTVHNDLHQHVGGGRRLAVVTQMSTSNWNEGCGGALVWCDPVDVIPPGFNSLALFATDHWSWHFVEPVWETTEDGVMCPRQGQHRFAWSGWYEYKTGGIANPAESTAQQVHADDVQKRAELQWLKARLDARLKVMEASTAHSPSRGVLTISA